MNFMLGLLGAIFNSLAFWFAHLKSELKSKLECEKALEIRKPPNSGKRMEDRCVNLQLNK